MKNIVRVAVVLMVVVALTAGQSMLMAAPTNGAAMASQHSARLGLFDTFLRIFGAIWGGNGRGGLTRVEPGTGGGSTDGGIWKDGRCQTC